MRKFKVTASPNFGFGFPVEIFLQGSWTHVDLVIEVRDRMISRRYFALSLVLALSSFELISGLKCYSCRMKDGVGDTGCDESPPPEKYLVQCAQPQCWLKYSNNGTAHFERFCVAVATNINGCVAGVAEDNKGYTHAGMECKCNDADGCNGKVPGGGGKAKAEPEPEPEATPGPEPEST